MQDAIDLSTVSILNSPDVRNWPATATISVVECTPNNTRFIFDKQSGPNAWPAQPFGDPQDAGDCQYTVWLFLRLNGGWFGAAFIDMWKGRDGVGDAVSDYVKNWLLPGRGWDPMVGHAIAPGETIGFMLSAGNARMNGVSSVLERSNIVTIAAPAGDTGDFTFGSAPAPAPVPVPPVVQGDEWEQLLAVGDAIVDALAANHDVIVQLNAKLDSLSANGLKVHV